MGTEEDTRRKEEEGRGEGKEVVVEKDVENDFGSKAAVRGRDLEEVVLCEVDEKEEYNRLPRIIFYSGRSLSFI